MGKKLKSFIAAFLSLTMILSLAVTERATSVQAATAENLAGMGAVVDEDGNLIIPYASPVIDGDLSDWTFEGKYEITIGGEASSVSDGFAGQPAKISYAWDETAIYSLIKVYDDNISTTTSSFSWSTWTNVTDLDLSDNVRVLLGEDAILVVGGSNSVYKVSGSSDAYFTMCDKFTDEDGQKGYFVEVRYSLADSAKIFGHAAQNGDIISLDTIVNYATPSGSSWSAPTKNGKAAISSIDSASDASLMQPAKLVKDESITTVAVDIGRYDLIKYLASVEKYFSGNIPASVADAYNAAKEEAASSTATAESLAAAKRTLEEAVDALTKIKAAYATPIVDGEIDEIWNSVPAREFEVIKDDPAGQTASVKTVWDETAVYSLVTVNDPTPDVSGSSDHLKDSIEFFYIPSDSAEANSYGSFGDQIRLNRAGAVTTSHGSADHFYGVVSETYDAEGNCTGYMAEVMWKFNHAEAMYGHSEGAAVQNGDTLAYNISLNLCEGGSRHGGLGLFTTDGYSNPSKSGTLVLEKDASITTVATDIGRYSLIEYLQTIKAEYTGSDGEIYADIKAAYDEARTEAYSLDATAESIVKALDALRTAVDNAKAKLAFVKFLDSYIATYITGTDTNGTFEALYKSYYDEAVDYSKNGANTDEISVRDAKIAEYTSKLIEIATSIRVANGYATDAEGKLMVKRGTPFVDGDPTDPIWDDALVVTLTNDRGDKAVVKALWDDNAMYLCEIINDTEFDISGSDAHAKDAVEVFQLSNADAALDSFGTYGGQWRLNRGNQITVTFGQNEPFYGRIKELYNEDGTSAGYAAELRLEFLKDAKDAGLIAPGYTQHFDFSVNIYANGSKQGGLGFYGTDNYNHPKGTGSLILLDAECEGGTVPANYNPYPLMKVVNKALEINPDDYQAADLEAYYDKAKLEKYAADAKAGILSEEEIAAYYDDVIDMMSKVTYDGEHRSVLGFAATDFPDTFTFTDGTAVETAEDWTLRAEEIKDLYEFYMYGKLPDGSDQDVTFDYDGDSTYTINITRKSTGVTKSFDFKLDLPSGTAPEGGWPYIINYGSNITGAQDAGYAVIEYSGYSTVASTGTVGSGIFYDLYPECTVNDYNKGVGHLAVRAWGAGLILDAIYDGTTGRLGELNADHSAVTGFSFLGKTALVTGVLEQRIAVVNPCHSGIGGAALIRWTSQGKNYTTAEYPKMEDGKLMTRQEPMGQVQGQGALWVKGIFADFLGGDNLPFDTYMLASLVAPRGLLISSGYYDQGTDPEGMYGTYLGAREVYRFLGAEGNIAYGDYPTAHANSTPETEDLFKFCDMYFYGKELPADFYETVYDESPDKPQYDVINAPLHTVTLNFNGFGPSDIVLGEYRKGEVLTLPTYSLSAGGYLFNGWSTDSNSYSGTLTYTVGSSDVTLYAAKSVDIVVPVPETTPTPAPENTGKDDQVEITTPETPEGSGETPSDENPETVEPERMTFVTSKKLYTNGTRKFKLYKVKPDNLESITFKSSNRKVVKVTRYGNMYAQADGTATVTVTVKYKDGVTETHKVKVTVKTKKVKSTK